jgi:hypothetical protein
VDQVWQLQVAPSNIETFIRLRNKTADGIVADRLEDNEDQRFLFSHISIDGVKSQVVKEVSDSGKISMKQFSLGDEAISCYTSSSNEGSRANCHLDDSFNDNIIKEEQSINDSQLQQSNEIQKKGNIRGFVSPIDMKKFGIEQFDDLFENCEISDFKATNSSNPRPWKSLNFKEFSTATRNRQFDEYKCLATSKPHRKDSNVLPLATKKSLNVNSFSKNSNLKSNIAKFQSPIRLGPKNTDLKKENKVGVETKIQECQSHRLVNQNKLNHRKKISFDLTKLAVFNLSSMNQAFSPKEDGHLRSSMKINDNRNHAGRGLAGSFAKDRTTVTEKQQKFYSQLKEVPSISLERTQITKNQSKNFKC